MNAFYRLFAIAGALLVASPAWATPAFARKQQLACPVCHTAFPELNATGRQFKEDGYRFSLKDSDKVATTGTDVGSGIILDPSPGIAVRVESVLAEVSPDAKGTEAASLAPLDSVELVMAGSNGDHWSYLAEMGAEAGEDYAVGGNAVLMYRGARQITAFAGWTPMFSRDDYNSLSESRRVDHVDHAVQDYTGSTGINMNTEGGVAGLFGRFGPVFYLAEAGPGPDAPIATGEPFDYVGRVGVDVSKNAEVGGFVYYGATPTDSTVRAGGDANLLTKSAGTFKLAGMYDTTDEAVLGELGWDLFSNLSKGVWLVPQARADLASAGGTTTITPMAGIGIQQSAGRVQVEVSEPLGDGSPPPPAILLIGDVVF